MVEGMEHREGHTWHALGTKYAKLQVVGRYVFTWHCDLPKDSQQYSPLYSWSSEQLLVQEGVP